MTTRDVIAATEILPLEDGYADVIGKAQRGLGFSDTDLAGKTGLSVVQIEAIKDGLVDADGIEQLARALDLHAASLLTLAKLSWQPKQQASFSGFAMFTTLFSSQSWGEMTVNAYLVWDPETREAASFDTGATCAPMLAHLETQGLTLKKLFITHTHQDHLNDLEKLHAETKAEAYGSAAENPLGLHGLRHGDELALGKLKIQVLGTSGHTQGGLSYYVTGLDKKIVVVGDSLFASSQGGAPTAYQEALNNNRTRILTLPGETIICPGHGPLTTVAEEHAHNPFFPELKGN